MTKNQNKTSSQIEKKYVLDEYIKNPLWKNVINNQISKILEINNSTKKNEDFKKEQSNTETLNFSEENNKKNDEVIYDFQVKSNPKYDEIFNETLLKIQNDIENLNYIWEISDYLPKLAENINWDFWKDIEYRNFIKIYHKLKDIFNSKEDNEIKLWKIHYLWLKLVNIPEKILNIFNLCANKLSWWKIQKIINYWENLKTQLEALIMIKNLFKNEEKTPELKEINELIVKTKNLINFSNN